MIIVALKGGLGNQLFQYALGRHLAIKNSDALKLDLTALQDAEQIGNIHRDYRLSEFMIQADVANKADIEKLKPKPSLLSKISVKIRNRLIGDPTVIYNPKFLEQTDDIYLDGYWQSPLYFESIRDTLLKELVMIKPLSKPAAGFLEQIKNNTSIALHVRRGDYIKNPQVQREFGPCSLSYYKNAIQEMEKDVKNPTYFVFSDDLLWVKKNLPVGERAVFVEGEGMTDVEDLVLMSMCQHNIIANSSFSWWGAWLNQNPGKIVIAPTPWFDRQPYDKNLIPESWIQIPKHGLN